jgi:hypothetical protein
MISESRKYKSDAIKVIGFALIAPFGRAISDLYLIKDFGLSLSFTFIAYTIVLLMLGLACILKGYNILEE